jgi:hypothetical protein
VRGFRNQLITVGANWCALLLCMSARIFSLSQTLSLLSLARSLARSRSLSLVCMCARARARERVDPCTTGTQRHVALVCPRC